MEAAERSLPPVEGSCQATVPSLAVLGRRLAPVTLANDRVVPVLGPLGNALPDGGLRRGSVIALEGAPGTGRTSLALDLVAAVTGAGEWAAVLSLGRSHEHLPGTPSAQAAIEALNGYSMGGRDLRVNEAQERSQRGGGGGGGGGFGGGGGGGGGGRGRRERW